MTDKKLIYETYINNIFPVDKIYYRFITGAHNPIKDQNVLVVDNLVDMLLIINNFFGTGGYVYVLSGVVIKEQIESWEVNNG